MSLESDIIIFNSLNNGNYNRNIDINTLKSKIFSGIKLSWNEQTYIRDKPKRFLYKTLELFNLTEGKLIVEIGAARNKMEHDIIDLSLKEIKDMKEKNIKVPENLKSNHPQNDGHATYFWCKYTNAEIYSCDIDESLSSLYKNDKRLEKTNFVVDDGIHFLKEFPRNKKIDLLFLDAWDVFPGSPFAEKHLEAYLTIKDNLSDKCLILIDDTDIGGKYGGKGKLLIPKLIEDGWTQLFSGRQTLFCNSLYCEKLNI